MDPEINPLRHINQSELAAMLSITPQSVSLWVKNKRVPARKVIQVERLTGIHRTLLNPDVYPPSDYKILSQDATNSPNQQTSVCLAQLRI